MSLERVCLDQQEMIAKQSAVISSLLYELAQFRTLSAEEKRLMDASDTGGNNTEEKLYGNNHRLYY